jgi:hypothetical protein
MTANDHATATFSVGLPSMQVLTMAEAGVIIGGQGKGKKLAGKIGGVFAAFKAGYEFGEWLDNKFDLSTKIANVAYDFTEWVRHRF